MTDRYKSSAAFQRLSEAMRDGGPRKVEHQAAIAVVIGKSLQTVRTYSSNPDRLQFRIPPIKALDKMLEAVLAKDVYQPSQVACLGREGGFSILQTVLAHYEVALDLGDSIGVKVRIKGGVMIPTLSDDARLRHQWRRVYFGGIADRKDLAAIAGTDIYDVAWVGREHPSYGRQPTQGMVAGAMALEALTEMRRAA